MSLQITVLNVPESKYNIKCPYSMVGKGVVFHNTAGNATAMSEASNRIASNAESSIHFFVDEERAVQCSPLDRNTWHAHDGGKGYANRNLWSIEVCKSFGSGVNMAMSATQKAAFLKAEENAAEIVAMLLFAHGLPANRDTLRWHHEFAATACPHRTKEYGLDRILPMVQAKMTAMSDEAALDPDEETPPTPTEPTGDSLYRVQVGAFRVKANAEAYKKTVEGKGYTAILKLVDGMYKVQMGAFASKSNAVSFAKTVRSKNFDAIVVDGDGGVVVSSGTSSPATGKVMTVGATVKVKQGAKSYEGVSLLPEVYQRVYVVQQLKGTRAVIGPSMTGGVTAAMNTSDLLLQ